MIILPSLEIVPAKYNTSTNTLLSQIPIDGTGDFTVTRATSATRVNGNGLIEVAKTNLAFNSQTWDASNNWQLSESSGRVTVVTSTSGTLAPDGTSTANAISPTSGNITHYFYSNSASAVNYVSGAVFTISAFFKKGIGNSGRYIQLTTANSRFVGNPYANFDLELGIALTVSGSVADSNRVSRIQNYENGWYRCSLTATCNNSTSITNGVVAALLTADTNARLGAAFAGNTSDYIFGWGAQLEEGSFASEYIPTTTVARTRFAGVTVDGTAAANIPRLDYLQPDGTIGCPALLVEPSAQNIAINSEVISGILTGASIDANVAVSPDGTTTADKLKEDSNPGNHNLAAIVGGALGGTVDSSPYRISIFAKADGRTKFTFFDNNQSGAGAGVSTFDLSNGTATGAGVIQNYGNGWYRCIISCAKTSLTSANALVRLLDAGGNSSYTGDGTSGILFWGKQLELGSVATSYIPTTVSGVTRAADVITDTTASGVIGQTEGTIYAEVDIRSFGNVGMLFGISDGTASNRVEFYKFTDSKLYVDRVSSTQSNSTTIGTNVLTTGIYKIAFAYKTGDSALFVNGVQVGSTAIQTFTFGLLTKSGLGINSSNSNLFNDRIRAVALYTTRLTDTQLALLTSPYTSYSSMASALSYTLG